MSRLALPARLARREVRRRPGRTLLVALLVALPVAGMAMAVIVIRTDATSWDEQWVSQNGQADASTSVGTPRQPLPVDLPDGSREVLVSASAIEVSARDVEGAPADAHRDRTFLEVSDLPMLDPIAAGMLTLIDGRLPTASGEVTMSPRSADRLDAEVGDVLTPTAPDVRLEVVGIVEQPSCLSCQPALVAPGSLVERPPGWIDNGRRVLIDLPPMSLDELTELRLDSDAQLSLRAIPEWPADDAGNGVRWTYVLGAVVLMVAGIVISAAFAVGARRQLVTIGQLSASGAAPSTLRTALMLQGTVTGLLGALLGLGLAAVALLAGRGLVERVLDARAPSYTVRPLELVVVAAIGVCAATLAALIPARAAAQIPTLAALAGRRPLAPVRRVLVASGVAAVAVGLGLLALAVLGSASRRSGDVWALIAIAGGVLELLGACAIAPAVVARLEPLAGRVRGPWRIAARGLARQRSRTGAVVSAVAAAGGLAVAATALVLGSQAQGLDYLEIPDDVVVATQTVELHGIDEAGNEIYETEFGPPPEAVVDQMASALGDAPAVAIRKAQARTTSPTVGESATEAGWQVPLPASEGQGTFSIEAVTVADEPLLDALRVPADVRRDLEQTGVVLLTAADEGPAVVTAPDGRRLDVVRHQLEYGLSYSDVLLVSEQHVADLGLDATVVGVLFDLPAPLTDEQRVDLDDLRSELGWSQVSTMTTAVPERGVAPVEAGRWLQLDYFSPSDGPTPFQLELLLSGLALVFALFVVGVSLALAAAESKDERDVLTIAGASPRVLARAAGARAWLLAGIGAAMAVPAGFLPVMVYARAETDDFPLVFPVRTVGLLLVAVPAVCAVVALASSATAQRLRPLRVSTATFE
jgi:putative ABC transport system permease protein